MHIKLTQLLECLSTGERFELPALTERLTVSESDVSCWLEELMHYGISVSQSADNTIQLPEPLELLNAECIQQSLSPAIRESIAAFSIHPSLPSTNQYLLDQPITSQEGYHVCFAEYQTQGRGRQGRKWHSPFAKHVYLSLSCLWEKHGAPLTGLSLAIGVAVADALKIYGAQDIQLKWPNDILWSDKKLGGILIELRQSNTGAQKVVIGIGLNIAMPSDVGAAVTQPWVDLNTVIGQPCRRNIVASLLVEHLVSALQQFQQQGFAAFAPQWSSIDALAGEKVTISTASHSVQGRAVGVDAQGGLILALPSGEQQRFYSGELVKVRKTSPE